MTDQLIEFDTAKLAKEKGLDINTGPNCWVKTLDGEIIHNKLRKDTPEHDRSNLYLVQPTQSLLQKWLRDIHKIYVSVHPVIFAGDYQASYYQGLLNNCTIHKFKFDTYEEALEKALIEGLNEIK